LPPPRQAPFGPPSSFSPTCRCRSNGRASFSRRERCDLSSIYMSPALLAGAVARTTPFAPNLFLDNTSGAMVHPDDVETAGGPAGLRKGLLVLFLPSRGHHCKRRGGGRGQIILCVGHDRANYTDLM
jgi:hypothetical protein